MVHYARLLVFFFVVTSCCCSYKPDSGAWAQNKIVAKHFNKYQRADLIKILDFFEQTICQSASLPANEVAVCYNRYLEAMAESATFGPLELSIPIDQQDSLMASLYSVTVDGIWEGAETNTSQQFGIRYGGNFHSYLMALGKQKPVFSQYSETFEQAGTISPSMIAEILTKYDQYDLADPQTQLVIAIHYLTLNKLLATTQPTEANEE